MSATDIIAKERRRWRLGRLRPWLAAIAFLTALGCASLFLPLGEWLHGFSQWVDSLGALGVVAFSLAYAVMTLLVIPGAPMTIAAGIAYGWWGLPIVLVSAAVGSLIAFLCSRYLFNQQIRRLAERRPRLRAAIDAVSDESWTVLALMRLSPVLPFNVQNYLLGLTDIRLSSFLASTLTGMVPGAALSVYVGILGFDASRDAGNGAKWALLIVGLIATILVTTLITRRARARLAARQARI